uniref:Ras-associating domain-containing protein n=1 Tax=Macrostomum lignano TaxID=282301 RepID=A0A1I8F5S0_9PLAT
CLQQQQQQQQQQQLQLQQQQEHHGSSQHVVSCLMLPNSNRSSTGGGGAARGVLNGPDRKQCRQLLWWPISDPALLMTLTMSRYGPSSIASRPSPLSSDAQRNSAPSTIASSYRCVSRAKLRLPAPCAIWMDVKKRRLLSNKRRLCLGFRSALALLHLLFLIKQTELGHAVSQRHPDMLPIRSLWCSLLDEAEFLPTVTSAFPALSQLDSMLREPSGPMRCEIKKSGSLGGWRVSQISLQEADQMLTVVTPRVTKSLSLKAGEAQTSGEITTRARELQLELQSGGHPAAARSMFHRCDNRRRDYRLSLHSNSFQATESSAAFSSFKMTPNWFHSMQCALSRSLSAQYLRHKRRSAATTGVAA